MKRGRPRGIKKNPSKTINDREKKLAYDRVCSKKYSARKDIDEYRKSAVYLKQLRDAALKRKLLILNAYSNGKLQCACCNEKEIKFLTLDHICGNGADERRKYSGSYKGTSGVYTNLILHNFPNKQAYRVLCYNCNSTNGQYGECPHEEARRKAMAMFEVV